MSLPQSTIDQYSRTKIGVDSSSRGKSRRIIAELLVTCDDLHADFYKYLVKLFPKLESINTKSVEYIGDEPHGCTADCNHEKPIFKAYDITQGEADGISRQFRGNFPTQYQDLLQYADSWLASLMPSNLPSKGAPFSAAYWDMITQGALFGYQSAAADKNRPNPKVPIVPFVVNSGEAFVKDVYTKGYGLVSSQITLGVLAPAMDSINKALSENKPWNEIADELTAQFGGKRSHWLRLTNTEMGIAANKGILAQAKALDEPATVMKWSASAATICPICGPRNGQLYALDSPVIEAGLGHPNCKCTLIVTFLKRNSTAVVNGRPEPEPTPEPENVGPVGAPNTGKGRATFTGKHSLSNEQIDALKVHADAKLKEYGINDDIAINLYRGKEAGGSIAVSRGMTKATTMQMSTYADGSLPFTDILNHELKHIQQVNSGRFTMNRSGDFMWDGEIAVTKAEFTRTMNKIMGKTAKSADEAKKAYAKYKSWPWEAEAFATEGK